MTSKSGLFKDDHPHSFYISTMKDLLVLFHITNLRKFYGAS